MAATTRSRSRSSARAFGIVFQDPSLDDELTAEENMELHAVLYRVPRAKAKAHRGALKLRRSLGAPRGFRQAFLGRHEAPARNRARPAAPAAHSFLDEPTLGLDPQTRNHIWEFIRPQREEGMTVFFTTHYMDEADRVADQIAVIDHGKIVAGAPRRADKRTGGRPWKTRSSR